MSTVYTYGPRQPREAVQRTLHVHAAAAVVLPCVLFARSVRAASEPGRLVEGETMNADRLRALVSMAVKYGVVAAGVAVGALYLAATYFEYPLPIIAAILGALGFLGVFMMVGPSRTGFARTEATVKGRFAESDPDAYVADSEAFTAESDRLPEQYDLGFFLLGLAVHGVVWLYAI